MKIATFDIEAKNWTEFQTLGFFDGVNYEYFDDLSDFVDFVLAKYRQYRIYAHFGGAYDFKFLIPILIEKGIKFSIIDNGSRIMQLKVTRGKNNYYFIDSFNLLPMSLKEVTRAFDVKHKKLDIVFDETLDLKSDKALKYLEHDVKGLYEALDKFLNWGLNAGTMKLSLAQQSLFIYKNQFLEEDLFRLKDDEEAFIRRCYYGGWVDIFKQYGENLFYYDFNSLYPTCMLEEMPTGEPLKSKAFDKNRIGFYEVDVFIPKMKISPVPAVMNGKLMFVCGNFRAFLSSAELELIKEIGGDFKVIRGIVFSERARIFEKYIKELYTIKEKAPKGSIDYVLSKLTMNSLYGKFGQGREKTEIIFCEDEKEIVEKKYEPYIEELSLYKRTSISRSAFILPYLSAYITALARCKLYRAMLSVGLENVFYCDTDSIFTTKELPTGKGLGDLKLEAKIKEAVFIQPKTYSIIDDKGKNEIKIKGFPKNSFTHADFKKALIDRDMKSISMKINKICGFKEALRRYKSPNIKRIEIIKTLRGEYSKRKILPSFDTESFIYDGKNIF